jgi:O-antigen/teichoic acid export membrane protein
VRKLWRWFQHNPSRWLRWTRLFTSFALVQLFVQLVNAIAGFLLIRTLEKPDYAWFTIASGMSTALSVLADAGIASAVTSLGGSIWQDKLALSNLVFAALRLRRQMALIATVIVTPLSLWLLMRNGTSMTDACALTLVILIPVWHIATASILNVVNRLNSRTWQLQVADAVPSISRALFIFVLVAMDEITPFSALFVSLCSQAIQYFLIRHQIAGFITEPSNPVLISEIGLRIRQLVRQLYPNAVFTCVQSQLSVWLISLFADINEVADFGALNRLAVIFTIASSPISQWLVPAFARAETQRRMYLILFASIIIVMGCFLSIVIAALFSPASVLWVLGPKYAHLNHTLIVILCLMASSAMMQTIWGLNMARGWVNSLTLNIPLVVITQIITLCFVPVGTAVGVAVMGTIVALVQCGHSGMIALLGILRFDSERAIKL